MHSFFPFSRPFTFLAIITGVLSLPVYAEPAGVAPTAPPSAPVSGKVFNFQGVQIRELSETLFQVGAVRFDKTARTASFSAKVVLREGLAEYLLVTDIGKNYESVLETTIRPFDLHVAMLLMGAKATENTRSSEPDRLDSEFLKTAPPLKGDSIEVSLSWKEGEKERRVAGEELLLNTQRNKPMSKGPWTYNGSILNEGRFLADTGGSIIALVTDPAALINNPRPGHDDDHVWTVRTKALPPNDAVVEVTIKLAAPKGGRK